MIGWWVAALIIGGVIGAGVLTIAGLRKLIKNKVSWRAVRGLITNVAKSSGAYHVSIAALDEDGDVIDRETVEAKKIDSDIYAGRTIDL